MTLTLLLSQMPSSTRYLLLYRLLHIFSREHPRIPYDQSRDTAPTFHPNIFSLSSSQSPVSAFHCLCDLW